MADRTIKPDDTHDLVLQNNDGSSKLELNEDQTVKVTTGSDAGEDFTVNSTQLVVEGDTGNVGINDATPSNRLVVDSGTTAATAMQIVSYGGNHALHLVDDDTNTGSAGMLIEGGGGDAYVLFKTDADDWKITVDGSEPNDPLLFYDYASASNVLTLVNGDVYSEVATARTWTVSGISGLSQTGNFYKRIGKMVFVAGAITGANTSNLSAVSISNLPYSGKTGSSQSISISVIRDNGAFSADGSAIIEGSSTITFMKSSQAAAFSSGTGTRTLKFSGWYEAESV